LKREREMMDKVAVLFLIGVICFSMLQFVHFASMTASTIIVPNDYPMIQEAINAASDGDTVFVRNGTYYENVVVNKTVELVGENMVGTFIDGSYTGVVVNATRDGISISGFTIRKSGTVWNIGGPPYGAGIYMSDVTNCSVVGNKFTDDAAAIQLEFGADGNVIANNTMTSVSLGWGTFDASMNSFIDNNVTSNGRGLGLNVNSDNNVISGNRIAAPEWVIALHACHYNNITENYVANGQIGIYLPDSSYNRVYHNHIVNNIQQVSLQGFPSHTNYWNDGYPSGGNYWSDYNGKDLYRDPYQNETGSDGIGDTAYVFDANNKDLYPLMKVFPWSENDIGITYIGRIYSFDIVVPLKTIVGLRFSLNISTFVMNYGDSTEPFNVYIYANDMLLSAFANVTLTSRQSAILNLRWNTTGFAYGNYTVRAVADNLSGETDILDNTYTDGVVYVGVPGDVNGDAKVDMKDIAYVAVRFGRSPRASSWSPSADLNDDEKINMFDVGFAARHFMGTLYLTA
jgi:parallel beta-helix repeat protein